MARKHNVDRVLYPTDEISSPELLGRYAKVDRASARQRSAIVTRFLGECHWEPDMPAHRRTAHNEGLIATALAKHADLATLFVNRPVPRQASCHFFGVDNSTATYYFY